MAADYSNDIQQPLDPDDFQRYVEIMREFGVHRFRNGSLYIQLEPSQIFKQPGEIVSQASVTPSKELPRPDNAVDANKLFGDAKPPSFKDFAPRKDS